MKSIPIFTIALTGLFPIAAHGVLVSDISAIPGDSPTIDFSQFFSIGRIRFDAGDPPIEIDTLPSETVLLRPISGTSVAVSLLGQHTPPAHPDNNYYLGLNGWWGPGRLGFLGIGGGNGSTVTARIEFANAPVSFVGGLFNYPPQFPTIVISALDNNLAVLEQYAVNAVAPISTPSQTDAGEFRGIVRSQNDIFAIQFTGPFAVIDDIRFGRVVPEPSAFSLSALAVIALILKCHVNRHCCRRSN